MAVGAAASKDKEESSTQWGWIVAGVLALALIVLGIVWWRNRHKPSTPPES